MRLLPWTSDDSEDWRPGCLQETDCVASTEDQAGELVDDLYCVVVLDTYSRPNM